MNSKVNYSGFTDMFGKSHAINDGQEVNWLSRLDAALSHQGDARQDTGVQVVISKDVLQSD